MSISHVCCIGLYFVNSRTPLSQSALATEPFHPLDILIHRQVCFHFDFAGWPANFQSIDAGCVAQPEVDSWIARAEIASSAVDGAQQFLRADLRE